MRSATQKPRAIAAQMDRQQRILWLALALVLTGGLIGQLLLLTSP